MRLTEDVAKARLRDAGIPVPAGFIATSPEEAEAAALRLGGLVMVKALVPANRRGKAGGVIGPVEPPGAGAAADGMLGSSLGGHRVARVYVEHAVATTRELFLSLSFTDSGPVALASCDGGVDVEDYKAGEPVRVALDPFSGLSRWEAVRLWERAGVESPLLPTLGSLTLAAVSLFRADDALLVELNPVTITSEGSVVAVGALMEVDDAGLHRQPAFAAARPDEGGTDRERHVAHVDRSVTGPSVRYVELGGDVGLLVGGGGAGLYQHDLLVAAGARPANHSDMGAGAPPEKLDALIDAILGHPNVRSLLVGYNLLQMARCDLIVERLLAGMERWDVPSGFPIVMRLDGLGDERARELAAAHGGIDYLPRGTTLAEGVRAVVEATEAATVTPAEGPGHG